MEILNHFQPQNLIQVGDRRFYFPNNCTVYCDMATNIRFSAIAILYDKF